MTAPLLANGTKVKVCGIVDDAELDILASVGVDFVGLWYGVAGGPHDLPLNRWVELAAAAVEKPAAVLVTFAKDAELLGDALAAAEGWRFVAHPDGQALRIVDRADGTEFVSMRPQEDLPSRR